MEVSRNNAYGQLGDNNDRNVPEQIKNLPKIISTLAVGESSMFLDCEGSVWSCGYNAHGNLGLGDTTHRNIAKKIELKCPFIPISLLNKLLFKFSKKDPSTNHFKIRRG